MRSVMDHNFSEVPSVSLPRSTFNRSHAHKTTFDADYLVPILVDDIIPGDTFNVQCHFAAQLASPTILPLKDNLFFETFFFFVPYRLLWDNFEKFMGAQDDPSDSIDFTIPTYSATSTIDLTNGSETDMLADYMGLPHVSSFDGADASALPFRAYNLIWKEWFRDQNLQDSPEINTGDGPDAVSDYSLLKRAKRFDYFTSSLPWPQKGSAVTISLGDQAPVSGIGLHESDRTGVATSADFYTSAGQEEDWEYLRNNSTASTYMRLDAATNATPQIFADLGAATGISINDFRLAYQTQRLLEKDARAGTRYVEQLKSHWGVTSPDFRLQRPEFLGGGSTPVGMSAVAQTTYQGTQTIEDAKGAMSGLGSVSGSHGFNKSFVEHGVIIGLANVRGDITYSQGLERYWSKRTRYDFYYPVLSQIGEQTVLNKEIFYQNSSADEDVFGYQERYAEYRYKPSRLSHLMRPDNSASLDTFHLSEDFATLPTLSDAFIQSNTGAPLDRALSVPSQPHFIADLFFDMRCARPMPLYGVPGNLDRF